MPENQQSAEQKRAMETEQQQKRQQQAEEEQSRQREVAELMKQRAQQRGYRLNI